ncbi:MAG: hypothetical protein ACOJUL_01075 [Candidatus Pollutiaquabacter aromativorans]
MAEGKSFAPSSRISIGKIGVVYRICILHSGKSEKELPLIRDFQLKPGEDGLSVDDGEVHSAEKTLAVCGSQYRQGKTEFKDVKQRLIYSLPKENVLSLELVDGIYEDKIYFTNKIGKPENLAHCIIVPNSYTDLDLPEFALKLHEIAVQNSRVDVDMANVERLIAEINDSVK